MILRRWVPCLGVKGMLRSMLSNPPAGLASRLLTRSWAGVSAKPATHAGTPLRPFSASTLNLTCVSIAW